MQHIQHDIPTDATPRLTAKDGVLFLNGVMQSAAQADQLAREKGFVYAEQLVKAIEIHQPKEEK